MKDRFKFRLYNKKSKQMIFDVELIEKRFVSFSNDEDLVLMQCTGLKDRNGKLIYEEDIVKVSGYGVEGIFKIYWEDVTAQFAISIYDEDCFEHSQSVMEVIGNIYENKELLEEQK